jgi:hypothetical protein
MVMTNYILEVQLNRMMPNRYTNHYTTSGACCAETIIVDILWQHPLPRKNRQIGDMLYGWLSKTTKNRDEAIAVLRKRAFSKEAYLQKHIREETAEIEKLRDQYAQLSQQPSALFCSCPLHILSRSGCQCGGV